MAVRRPTAARARSARLIGITTPRRSNGFSRNGRHGCRRSRRRTAPCSCGAICPELPGALDSSRPAASATRPRPSAGKNSTLMARRSWAWGFTRGQTPRTACLPRAALRNGATRVSCRSSGRPRLDEHSEKPDEAYSRMQRLFAGPYLELFGRKLRPGWTVWGNEIRRADFTGPRTPPLYRPPTAINQIEGELR